FGWLFAASVETAAALSVDSNWAIRSAAAFAAARTGIDCTRPKHAPTTNNRAVAVMTIELPSSDVTNLGATKTTAPSARYSAVCANTVRLWILLRLYILELAAALEISN